MQKVQGLIRGRIRYTEGPGPYIQKERVPGVLSLYSFAPIALGEPKTSVVSRSPTNSTLLETPRRYVVSQTQGT